jgi:hypothetical protein
MLKILNRTWWGRKITRCIFRKRYFMFIWKENTEWDWQSIIDMLDLKFTIMGTTIWKWGVSVESRNAAHRCWLLRKHLRDIMKADAKGKREVDLLFKDVYGFLPEFDFKYENFRVSIPLVIPKGFDESKREEMEKVYRELTLLEPSEWYAKEAIRKFCLEFERSILYLWD